MKTIKTKKTANKMYDLVAGQIYAIKELNYTLADKPYYFIQTIPYPNGGGSIEVGTQDEGSTIPASVINQVMTIFMKYANLYTNCIYYFSTSLHKNNKGEFVRVPVISFSVSK